MNRFLIICLMLILGCAAYPQAKQKSADELKKEMAQIRQNTDWSNQADADSAQVKIEALSKQLMMIRKMEQQQQTGAAVDSAKLQEEVDYKMKMWHQMMKSVAQGEGGDFLLATPFREEIVEAYQEDESPKKISKEYLQEMTILVIDMSLPTIQRTIDQMQRFKSIKTLIITGGDFGAPVNLDDLLTRAAGYPLKTLIIINFRQFVSSIPDKLDNFDSLTSLGLFNNNLDQLPDLSGIDRHLDSLYIDVNPISTLFPAISQMTNLKKLGVAKTNISEAELGEIEKLIPECQILTE